MQIPQQVPHVGDFVRVRRHRWRVIDVRAYDDACQLIALSGAGGSNVGVERRVLAPFDIFEPVDRPSRLRVVGRRSWRRRCNALLASSTPPGRLRAACRAAIDLLPHQLEPALALIGGLGSRLLLADDVGLGKTIQAGLALAELRARGAVERALVLTPAGLRDQWSTELARRFDLTAPVVDAREVRRRVATLPSGVNPWSTIPIAIASVDYVKRPEVHPAVLGCRWDMLIVDEAHASAADTDRHDAVAALAARAAYVLLLTATPHNGDSRAFEALCDIGAHGDSVLLFRRTRADVQLGAPRHVHKLHIRPSAAERRMHALVDDFSRAVLDAHRRRRGGGNGESGVWLALSVLHKRAVSSAWALERSVSRRLASAADTSTHQLLLPLADTAGELDDSDELADWPEALTLDDADRERRLLHALAAAARAACGHETKLAAIRRLLARAAEPVVIFTEYRDTLLHLRERLDCPTVVLHGGLAREARADAIAMFVSGGCRVLLATDAAGEGLNLHESCRVVINLELPWNPMRLEQRIGRVDRIGQRRTVHAFHLIAAGTSEMRVLERLAVRVARAKQDVAAPNPLASPEEAIARAAIGGEPCVVSDPPTVSASSRTVIVRLDADQAAEGARLAAARRHLTRADADRSTSSDVGAPWLADARGWRSRMALGTRVLVLMRAAMEDEAGRLSDWTIVPLGIDLRTPLVARLNCRSVEAILETIRGDILALAVGATDAWQREVKRCARRFVEMRIARERAIASAAEAAADSYQPNLFDRRAERAHLESRAAAAGLAGEAARRIASWQHASVLSARPVELLLVLAP